MSKPRRRVIISSDEDSESERSCSGDSEILSEDGAEVVNDSVVDDSIVAASDEEQEDVPSTPLTKSAHRNSPFVTSTPLYKKVEPLDETFERMSVGDSASKTTSSRSLSSSSVDSTNDRDRSFHAKEAVESPISKRLGACTDTQSKQALRERVMRKQAMAARSSHSRQSEGRSSLGNAALSPVQFRAVVKPAKKEKSPTSYMDTKSPLQKSSGAKSRSSLGSTLPECTDESMREANVSDQSSPQKSMRDEEDESREEKSDKRVSDSSSVSRESEEYEEKECQGKTVRKKLNLDDHKKEEDKIKKWLTPRKNREEENDVKSDPLPAIESGEESEKEVHVVEIDDSEDDDEKEKEITNSVKKEVKMEAEVVDIIDSDDGIEELSVSLKEGKVEKFQKEVRQSPPKSIASISSSSLTSTGYHPSTERTYTREDVETMEKDLHRLMKLLSSTGPKLPDQGALLRRKIEQLTTKMECAKLEPARRVAPPEVKGKLQVIDVPAINPYDYNKMVVQDGQEKKHLMGGVMTYDRMQLVKRVTGDTLDRMLREMKALPEGIETATPRGLKVELMGHQKTGLTWMLWRERQSARGGILADDMGLGKTMSMISLVLQVKNERLERQSDDKFDEMEAKFKRMCTEKKMVASHSTLVIAPASVIFQWESEIEKRVKGDRLSVLVFHGPKNKREDRAKKLAKYDIVITTYNIITAELTEKVNMTNDSDESEEEDEEDAKFGKQAAVAKDGKTKSRVAKSQISVLTKVHWERIILDEAHQIKNRNSLISKAVCRLPGLNRWCLTGTPVHNNLYDLFSLVRFLKIDPFGELSVFKHDIVQSKSGHERLNIIVKSLLLRRLKSQVDTNTNLPLVSLKPKQYECHHLELEGLEKSIYECMFKAVQTKVSSFMDAQQEEKDLAMFGRVRRRKNDRKDDKEKEDAIVNPFLDGPRELDTHDKFRAMTCMLVFLLRLRQAVVHLSLTKEALDLSAFEGLPMNTKEDELEDELSQMSLCENPTEGEQRGRVATEDDVRRMFRQKFLSTKVRVLLEKLDHAVKAGDKCVVVSQWTSVLKIVQYHLSKRDIEYTEITGEIATQDRQERVDSFNRTEGGAQVMLLSLTAGGVGLNLIGGNHLFLVDLHWNPALEAQACDRIYRMGQKKNVYVHKLLSKGTIEESILALQNRKSAMAKSVLEGVARKDLNKLTMADLRFLFDLDGEKKKKEQEEEANKRKMQKDAASAAATAATADESIQPAAQPLHFSTAINSSVYGSLPENAASSLTSDGYEVITL